MTASAPAPDTAGDALFDRVVVGIDETPESLVGAAQARRLCAPKGRLELLAVAETYLAAHAGAAAIVASDDLRAGASAALERARELVAPDETRLLTGRLTEQLCAESERTGANLIAIGVRPHRRLAVLTFGGHDIEALHDAPCTLLIARPGWGPAKPHRIVLGVDGAPDGRAAEAAARTLAARLDRELVPVVGLAERDVDVELVKEAGENAVLDPGDLAHAVVSASTDESLVVIGRRRRHDRRWGGSVAERVVYSAHCSVLVVRHRPGESPEAP